MVYSSSVQHKLEHLGYDFPFHGQAIGGRLSRIQRRNSKPKSRQAARRNQETYREKRDLLKDMDSKQQSGIPQAKPEMP